MHGVHGFLFLQVVFVLLGGGNECRRCGVVLCWQCRVLVDRFHRVTHDVHQQFVHSIAVALRFEFVCFPKCSVFERRAVRHEGRPRFLWQIIAIRRRERTLHVEWSRSQHQWLQQHGFHRFREVSRANF